ncbi:MAG TPA: hypothetical protein VHE81_21875 [Lacipirellulaceae bacterium]|nr:hypothetical protein [Lacipirellulaceae bacterium]
MPLRSAAKTLLVLAIAMPVVQSVLVWVRGMLASMGDPEGGAIIGYIGTACGIAWLLCLVGLLVVVALIVLNEPPPNQ